MITVAGHLAPVVARDGFAICRGLIPPDLVQTAADSTADLDSVGMRQPLERVPALRAIAACPPVAELLRRLLGVQARVVRAVLFDKTPQKNWLVAPHRDTTIAVNEKADLPGYGPWSVKSGTVHCRPPFSVLESMLTLRIAIDPAGEDSGPLLVLPGSHHADPREPLPSLDDPNWRACLTDPGDAVLMRPLLGHASRRAVRPSRRRILHLECSAEQLPAPLRWAG
jgi:ectoine hydroxylase-related dioxygenase (phytanoyl-CoA dioxygenase family)